MRTHWELEGKNIWNTLGTRGKWKKKKKSFPLQLKREKKKNQGTLSACLGLPIGCMKFLVTKEELVTIFGMG
jgi:hypothetical protein